VQSLVERYIQLSGNKYVDEIIPYETEADLLEVFKGIDFDKRFLGEDWKGKDFTGHDLPDMQDKVIFNKREHDYSSSGLRQRVAKGESLEKKKKNK
jgi:glycerol-3-phosphate cytidylyltransferase